MTSNRKTPSALANKRPRSKQLTNQGIIDALKEQAGEFRISNVQKQYGEAWAEEVSKKYGLAPQDTKADAEKLARQYLRGEFDRIAREIGVDSAKLVEMLDGKVASPPVATTKAPRPVATGPTTVKGMKAAKRQAKAAPVATTAKTQVPEGALRKSTVQNPVERAWQIFDETREMRRKDVIQKCLDSGIAFYTARTQYQVWKSAGKSS
jgi:hypothetical protein